MTILTIVPRKATKRAAAGPRPVIRTAIVSAFSPKDIDRGKHRAEAGKHAPSEWTERFQKRKA